MIGGYVGEKSRRRSRYRLLFLFFLLLIGVIIFFTFSKNDTKKKIVKIDEFSLQKNKDILINNLENKIFENEQKLRLRDNLISSLKNQIKILEGNNDELINAIREINLENEQNSFILQKNKKDNLGEIEQLQNIINKLNKEIKKINANNLSIKKENDTNINQLDIILKQISIIENNNKTLELQKEIALRKIEELNNIIIEKDKLIKEMKDKIHH